VVWKCSDPRTLRFTLIRLDSTLLQGAREEGREGEGEGKGKRNLNSQTGDKSRRGKLEGEDTDKEEQNITPRSRELTIANVSIPVDHGGLQTLSLSLRSSP
jgi:hypothetical protein